MADGLEPRRWRRDPRNHQRHSGSRTEDPDQIGGDEHDRRFDEEEVQHLIGQPDAGHDAELAASLLHSGKERRHGDDESEAEPDHRDQTECRTGHLAGEQRGEILLEGQRAGAAHSVINQPAAVCVRRDRRIRGRIADRPSDRRSGPDHVFFSSPGGANISHQPLLPTTVCASRRSNGQGLPVAGDVDDKTLAADDDPITALHAESFGQRSAQYRSTRRVFRRSHAGKPNAR